MALETAIGAVSTPHRRIRSLAVTSRVGRWPRATGWRGETSGSIDSRLRYPHGRAQIAIDRSLVSTASIRSSASHRRSFDRFAWARGVMPRVGVRAYTQLLNEFKASYFAGALLMPKDPLEGDIAAFFEQKTFQPERLWAILDTYNVTPEMLLHRLTEILPGKRFGIKKLHFLRFRYDRPTQRESREWQVFSLTKLLDLDSLRFPYVESSGEKYCRRYSSLQVL